jgi:hypothetical protein
MIFILKIKVNQKNHAHAIFEHSEFPYNNRKYE